MSEIIITLDEKDAASILSCLNANVKFALEAEKKAHEVFGECNKQHLETQRKLHFAITEGATYEEKIILAEAFAEELHAQVARYSELEEARKNSSAADNSRRIFSDALNTIRHPCPQCGEETSVPGSLCDHCVSLAYKGDLGRKLAQSLLKDLQGGAT